jgi:Domain of unknown function (DUF4157)
MAALMLQAQARPASSTRAPSHRAALLATAPLIGRHKAGIPPFLQRMGLQVSSPHDAAEREAVATARAVVSMATPTRTTQTASGIQRASLRSVADSGPRSAHPALGLGSGRPLPMGVRRYMEPRFGADFGGVRIHTDDRAAQLNRQLGARAFASGQAIAFGRGEFQPATSAGRELIAHELTHTIQQGAAIQRAEAPASATSLTLDPRDYFAQQANIIPGFRMFTLIIGVNPINNEPVPATTANILRAFIELIPGGALITTALDKYGVFDKAGAWIDGQLKALGLSGAAFTKDVARILDRIDWLHPIDSAARLWVEAEALLSGAARKISTLASNAFDAVVGFIRDAVLMPLANLAKDTRGWDLLCAVLGKNPITGVAVPPTPENLIGGFMTFIGQQEVWKRIQETNAIAKVFAWFKNAWATVKAMVTKVPDNVLAALRALVVEDLLDIPKAIGRVVGVLGAFVGDFLTWGGNAVWNLLEIVIKAVSPEAWTYIQRTGAALRSILRDPLPFVGNLVKAAKQGFNAFSKNFANHLKAGLIDWLIGALSGIYIPKALTLKEIAAFVMSALGLSWGNIRSKLVAVLGDPAVVVLETTFDIVVTLVRDGPVAAWEKIKEQLANLKDMAIGAIQDFVIDMVVEKAIPRLISMFIPGAGFITALVSIYGTIKTFIAKIGTIAAAVTAFIDSIVAIAAGNIGVATAKVEQVLAGALKMAINLLAGFLGMGSVSEKIMAILKKIRAPIDKAIDWLVGWIAKAAKAVTGAVKAGVKWLLEWWRIKKPVRFGTEQHTLQFDGEKNNAKLVLRSVPQKPSEFLDKKRVNRPDKKAKDGTFVKNTETAEATIAARQKDISKLEGSGDKPLSGAERTEADKVMKAMDAAFTRITNNIVDAYDSWGYGDLGEKDVVGDIELKRGSFTDTQKIELKDAYLHDPEISKKLTSEGKFKKGAKLARRHIVSSQDMVDHYKQTLSAKTLPEAALLISERASIAEARAQVEGRTKAAVVAAAKARYGKFFGYINNLFVGDSLKNSELGRVLDRDYPGLASTQLLSDHIARIKREWSFGGSFKVSAVSRTQQIESTSA